VHNERQQEDTMTAHAMPDMDVDLRLLLVEDDARYASFIGMTLMSVGSARFQYDHVTSIRGAVDRLSDTTYDLVLLDLGLPDADELSGLTTVVGVVPDVPVVILSSAEDEALALRAVKAGAQDYLSKGSTTGEVLARSIRYAIERKHSELQIKRLAYRDSLTQLPNRAMLMEHLDTALKRAHRERRVAGLFFIDIDHFKQINDTLGHQAGDEVLRQLAERLRRTLRNNDTLARLSGDEFVAVVEVKRRAGLVPIAEKLQHQLKAPFMVSGRELFVTASIGVSAYPSDGTDAQKLLRNADRAMYRAKGEGRDVYRFYTRRVHGEVSPKLAFTSGLRRAIDRGELLLHFQPLVDLRIGQIDGLEALVRWQHPSMGLIPPGDFIPVAEESELILSIERWVLKAAMSEALAYERGHALKLAINLSSRHFDHPDLLNELKEITRTVGYDPKFLELELTERGLMHHPKRVLRHLKEFRRLGIQVAVDDFGTGYSCLGLMKRFPLHALKIDRSFVRNCATDQTNQALVAAIIRMGHALGLSVTAEGVETAAQLAYLRQQRCDRAQGSYFSRPIPGTELLRVLRRHERRAPHTVYGDADDVARRDAELEIESTGDVEIS
jgi:diguanylate cyclase (GGDEF)-like protein